MEWIKNSWSKFPKTDDEGNDIPGEYEDFYYFKDEVDDADHATGGVDIQYDSTGFWIIDFWGKYRDLVPIFSERYCRVWDSLEEAQKVADEFLYRIFGLKAFL
jgi:hypothetical protein